MYSPVSSQELNDRTGVTDADTVRQKIERRSGHLEHKKLKWPSLWCRNDLAPGARGRGRDTKTFEERVRQEMKTPDLKREMAQDRTLWMGLLVGKPFNPSYESIAAQYLLSGGFGSTFICWINHTIFNTCQQLEWLCRWFYFFAAVESNLSLSRIYW